MEATTERTEEMKTEAALPAIRLDDLKVEILRVDPANIPTTIQVVIETQEQYVAAVDLHRRLGGRRKEWKAQMDPIVAARRIPWQEATDHRGAADEPLEVLEKAVGKGMAQWQAKQDAIAKEAERKRQEGILAEQKRQAQEQEAARQKQIKDDEDKRLALAAKLEAEGKTELAEHVLTTPAPPPPPTMPPPPRAPIFAAPVIQPPKVDGISYRDNWKVKIPDDSAERRAALHMLVQAAAKNPDQYLAFLTFEDARLNKHANDNSGLVPVPGLTQYNDKIPVRARR